MSLFSAILLAMAAFFAYQIFLHVNKLQDSAPEQDDTPQAPALPELSSLVEDADIAYENGDYPLAAKLLRDAQAQEGENTEVLNKLGFVLAKEGRNEEALEVYQASLQIDANDDMLHNAIASLYRQMKRYDEAKYHYEKALEIDDAYAVTYFNFANLLVDMDEKEKAKAMYGEAIRIDPDFTQAKFEKEKLK